MMRSTAVVAMLATTNGLLLQAAVAPRGGVVSMNEERAKQAWLAKLEQPSWGGKQAARRAPLSSGPSSGDRRQGMRVPQAQASTEWGDHLSDYVAPNVAMGVEADARAKTQTESTGGTFTQGSWRKGSPPEQGWGDHLSY